MEIVHLLHGLTLNASVCTKLIHWRCKIIKIESPHPVPIALETFFSEGENSSTSTQVMRLIFNL